MSSYTFAGEKAAPETSSPARQPENIPESGGLRPSQVRAGEPASSSVSGGAKIWFKTREWESPPAPAGPFDVHVSVVFEAEVDLAPEEGGAGAGRDEKRGERAGEEHGGWEVHGGTTHSLANPKEQGVKAEAEHALAGQWPGLLEKLRPNKVSAEGELTGEGGELSLGGKWGDEPVDFDLKLTVIDGKWEEGKIHVLDLCLSKSLPPHSFHVAIGGVPRLVTVTGEATAHVEPNWKRIAVWLAARGITAASASAAAGVAVAYVAFVGFGLYEMDQAVKQGRGRMIGVNFMEGYADELAAATEPSPLGRGDEVALLEWDWKSSFNEAKADYDADRISVFAAASRAKQAGRACVLESIGQVLGSSGIEGWRLISAQHRARYGVSQKSRSEHYRTVMLSQALQGKTAGIELKAL